MIRQILNNDNLILGHIEQLTENLDTQRFVITDYCITCKLEQSKSAAAHLYFAQEVR
jgi:hypothetical protein